MTIKKAFTCLCQAIEVTIKLLWLATKVVLILLIIAQAIGLFIQLLPFAMAVAIVGWAGYGVYAVARNWYEQRKRSA